MNDFVRSNKVSGVYWLKAPVKNIKFNIKIKPPDDILSLPKFDDFANSSDNISIQANIEEYAFNWQEKVFCNREIQHYSEIHNCVTENEVIYHENIKNNDSMPSKVFSYIDRDGTIQPPGFTKKVSVLEHCMKYLNLDSDVGSIGRALSGKSDSSHHLLKSRSSLSEDDKWMTMQIVYDYSDPNEETQYLKQEATLLTIYHNTTQNYIIISPNTNDLVTNPYTVEGLDIKYGVEVDFGETSGGDELELLLSRLHLKWEMRRKTLVHFETPSHGKTQYYVTIELASALGFETDKLYIEYTIKLPEGVVCNDSLHGRTHTAKPMSVDSDDVWHFGHVIELSLETELSDPSPLKLYLEVISTDWKRVHRTEGYCYQPLCLSAGLRTLVCACRRAEERSWRAQEIIFFLGGCNMVDLDALSRTDGQNSNFTYATTGTVHLRCSVIRQSSTSLAPTPGCSSSSGSALLQGAEAALSKYKKARARLAAATRDIHIGGGGDT